MKNMQEVAESKDTYHGIGDGLYIKHWKGVISIAHACVEGTPMKPFVRFKLRRELNVVIGCYFCKKRFGSKEMEENLAVDIDGSLIISESKQLTNSDSHFVCKACWNKVTKFCDIKLK